MLCPNFVYFVEQHDIIVIQVGKLDDVDMVQIQGYTIFTKNLKALSRYRSGGKNLLAKNDWPPFITINKSDSKLILWFAILKQVMTNNEEFHCGIILHTIQNTSITMLFGDFNSRWLCHMWQFHKWYPQKRWFAYKKSKYLKLLWAMWHSTTGKNVWSYYKLLWQTNDRFCKYNYIFMAEWIRIDLPKLTCKGSNTVDYFISIVQNFPFIKDIDCSIFRRILSKHNIDGCV